MPFFRKLKNGIYIFFLPKWDYLRIFKTYFVKMMLAQNIIVVLFDL